MKEDKNVIKINLAVNFSFFLNQKIYIPMNDDIDRKKIEKNKTFNQWQRGSVTSETKCYPKGFCFG